MEVKGVIFDFNGTLFMDHDKHQIAWNKMALLLRDKAISQEELYTKLNGVPNKEIIRYLTRVPLSDQQIQDYSLMKEQFYREACLNDQEHFHLVKGVEAYFNLLKQQGIPFTIASASIKENIDFFIHSFHLDKWIDVNTIIYDNGAYTSKEAMFLEASRRLKVDIKDCLVFEDSLSGIKHAYQAGCKQIIVMNSTESENYRKLPGVVQIIHDFSEVI